MLLNKTKRKVEWGTRRLVLNEYCDRGYPLALSMRAKDVCSKV